MKRPRVAAVGGYMAYFETVMGPDARRQRTAHLDQVTAPLSAFADVSNLGLLVNPADAARLVELVGRDRPDVLLIVPTMATPPGPMLSVIEAAGVPVVIACGHDLHAIGADYDKAALCRHSVNVGATMVESLMRRRGLVPTTVVGDIGDAVFHERVATAVRAAHLAAQMKGLRLGRLGLPMPGYDHVGLTLEEAADSDIMLVDVPLADWAARVAAVTPEQVETFLATELPALAPPGTVIGRDQNWRRAARLAVALARLSADEGLNAGSLTCRGDFGLGLPDGSIGCLATSIMTARGIPFSATGDLLVAVAMLMGRGLGGATLYCELDAIDRDTDRFLVANTGEGDFAWTPEGGRCVIRPAGSHSGTEVPGLVIEHDLDTGPATMVGAALDRSRGMRLTLAAMEGRVPGPATTGLRVTHGWFETNHRPAVRAMERWIATGATHHGALSRGHLAEGLSWLARQAGFGLEMVDG